MPRVAAWPSGGGELPDRENRTMTDSMPRPARSRNMQRITAKNTKPEVAVRRYLHSQGLRYSLFSLAAALMERFRLRFPPVVATERV